MKKLLVFSALAWSCLIITAQEIPLTGGWRMKMASEVAADGSQLTLSEPDMAGWLIATVPGTVLTTLINNKVMPDPYFGLNNATIPDVYTEGRDYYTYWFFTRFSTESLDSTKQVWLNFRGINYFAEIWLNGRHVNVNRHEGMFLREKYNITPYLNRVGSNRLAVLVEPPANPGNPNGGQGGDGMIGRDATMQFTAGWDWVQPVRDRNTGIWDKVSIEVTGDADIRNSFARTRVPGARLPGELQDPAFVTFSAEIENPTDKIIEGDALISFLGRKEKKKLKLEPFSTVTVTFNEIKVTDPRIWWPNGIGQPSLYPAVITFETRDKVELDREDFMFGFREAGSYFDDKTGSRVFTINGQKLFIRGANWIASDALLRLSAERYDAEVKMHAEMNMNMIRVWGGSIFERPEFYDACDRNGILVWQDLWITGDCNGRWPDPSKNESQERRREYPDNDSLFLRSLEDQMRMTRNHPSLYLICGGNEFPPPPGLDTVVKKAVDNLGGLWVYLDESTSPDLIKNTKGGTADGPYIIQEPLWFFTEKGFPFNPEIGSVGMPNIETLKKIMEEKDLVPPNGDTVNEVWKYHKYLGYGDMISSMGEVSDLKDFVTRAQIAGYDQYRSLVEGHNSHMWDWYTGVLVWKSQNPWPALKGQFYDWFLDQNAGFYGYKHGASPIHLQFNPVDSAVYVVNATPKERKGVRLEALLADENGRQIWKKAQDGSVPANSVVKLWDVDLRGTPALMHILRLRITYVSTGLPMDDNTYWLPYNDDRTALTKLPEARVVGQMMKSNNGKFTIDLANSGGVAAFFVRMKVIRDADKEIVTPVFFDDNYIVLLPGERKSIIVDTSMLTEENKHTPLLLHLEGMNLPALMIRL